jgi:hypothetical protein
MGEAARAHALAHFSLQRFTNALTDALLKTQRQ